MTRVDVWWSTPSAAGPELVELLSEQERERGDSFRAQADRDRFLVGAALVRCAVGERLATTPGSVRVDRTCDRCGAPHGRPRIAGGPEVSVTHAGDVVAVALAAARVGIDVEATAGRQDAAEVAGVALTLSERARLPVRAGQARSLAVLDHWVAKEAVLKASGLGLRVPMTNLELAGRRPPFRVRAWYDAPQLVEAIELYPLGRCPEGYRACLAVIEGGRAQIVEADAAELLARHGVGTG